MDETSTKRQRWEEKVNQVHVRNETYIFSSEND